MEREYRIYLFVQKLLNAFPNDYKYKNMVERWVISKFNQNKNSNNKFVDEMIDKNLLPKDKATKFVKKASNIFDKLRKYSNNNNINNSLIKIHNGNMSYKDMSMTIPPARMKLLFDILEYKNIKNPKYIIGRMLMKYATVMLGGQHWSVPYDVYKYLYDNYNATIEGFASPINSQMLKVDYKTTNFCSLFYDTDKYFGSLGSFFDLDVENKSIVVNPPFIEKMLKPIVEKILELQKKNNLIFSVMPFWPDTEAYELIKKYSKYCKILERLTYSYWDTKANVEILARFNSLFSVFHLRDNVNYDFTDIYG